MSALDRAEGRLLQPIYNALDTRNVGGGLRACTQVIPRLRSRNVRHVAMAIKAHLLLLSKKRDEAAQLSDELIKDGVDSQDAMHYVRVTLTALDRANEIGPLFQQAFDKDPTNGTLGLQLCMVYVRAHAWKDVQKIAFKLHSLIPDDPRPYSWSIYALLAQGLSASSPSEAKHHLSLARALLGADTPSNAKSPSHIWLRVSVLLGLAASVEELTEGHGGAEAEGVLAEAWDFLQSDEARRMGGGNLEVDGVRWDVVHALGKHRPDVWRAEWEILRSRILGEDGVPPDDNYQLYLNLISLTLLLHTTNDGLRSKAQAVFQQLSMRNGGVERGPWLALMQLDKELPPAELSVEPVKAYFNRLSTKACCFEDLKPFLPASEAHVAPLREHLKASLEPEIASLHDVRARVNALKLLRYLSSSLPSDAIAGETEWIVERCKTLYVKGLPFGKDLNKDELQPVDDFVIIAVNVFVAEWASTNDTTQLLQAVLLLEHAQKASTMNHYFRLLLIRIYRLLAAPSLAKPCYQALKVDHVQHDTLSHFLTTRASTFSAGDGLESDSASLLALTGRGSAWFKQTTGADTEQLVAAVANEVYPQVSDLANYLSQLSSSLQRQVLSIEYAKQFLLVPGGGGAFGLENIKHTLGAWTKLPKGALKDNRDFALVPDYQARGAHGVEELLQAGPRVDSSWVESMRTAYTRVFRRAAELHLNTPSIKQDDLAAPDSSHVDSSTTPDERALLALVDALLAWSREAADPSTKTQPSIADVKQFFAAQSERLNGALEDARGAPWRVLHAAAVALDGFALLLLLVKALPASRTRSLTDPVVSVMKSLASRLKQQAEKVGSAKTLKDVRKTLPSLAAAGVKDEVVVEVVGKVGASRREALNGLSRALSETIATAVAA